MEVVRVQSSLRAQQVAVVCAEALEGAVPTLIDDPHFILSTKKYFTKEMDMCSKSKLSTYDRTVLWMNRLCILCSFYVLKLRINILIIVCLNIKHQ